VTPLPCQKDADARQLPFSERGYLLDQQSLPVPDYDRRILPELNTDFFQN